MYTVSPFTSFRRANTSLGKMTPTELPICVSLSADMMPPVDIRRYNDCYNNETAIHRQPLALARLADHNCHNIRVKWRSTPYYAMAIFEPPP